MSRPTAGTIGCTVIWIFILASRTQVHQCMLKSENISQWSRPLSPIAMIMPRKCSSFKNSLKKWLANESTADYRSLLHSSQCLSMEWFIPTYWLISTQMFFYFQKIFPVELKMHSFSRPYGQMPESVNISVLTLDLSNSNGFYIWFRILHV